MESKIIGKTHYHLWVALSYESGKLNVKCFFYFFFKFVLRREIDDE